LAPGNGDLIGKVVAGKYRIRHQLGATAMNEVYLADHIALGVPFALKRPAPSLGSDAEFRLRLLEEGRRAVSLKHENVTRVHDVIESGEDVFLVMEYIEGETLRSRLARSQCCSPAEFLDIAVQCASALAAAHAKRIVHLDVKPENIMITPSGEVKICDFGVARKLSSPAPPDTTAVSDAWTFAGTPAYMAPEVILSYQFDERADLFSLGIVFYEMLTGQNPFVAETMVATTARIVSHVPEPVRRIKPGVDSKLESIVIRLLAKEPENRYANADDLLQDLLAARRAQDRIRDLIQNVREMFLQTRKFELAAALILLLGITLVPAYMLLKHRWVGTTFPEKKIVAVLPFRVIGQGRGEGFYSEGISEILTGKLVQLTTVPDLQVISEFEISDRKVDTIEKARAEFGATLVLRGSVQFVNDQVLISYDLIDPRSRSVLRAGSKKFPAADPIGAQEAVTRDIASLMQLELTPSARQALRVFGTANPRAFFLYTAGRGALRNFQEPENIDAAIQLFTQATEADASYAAGFAALGQSYWRKFGIAKEKAWLDQAEKACESAAEIAPNLSEAYSCLGLVNRSKGEYESAVTQFNHAIAMDHANDDAQRELGRTFEASARFDEAEKAYLAALQVRPQYWEGYLRLGAFYLRTHHYDKAIEDYRKALALCPDSGQLYYALGGAYAEAEDYRNAVDALQKSIQLRPYWQAYYNLGQVHLKNRQYVPALDALQNAVRLTPTRDYRLFGALARTYWLNHDVTKARQAAGIAIPEAEKLVKLNGRDSDVLLLLGKSYAIMGRQAEAVSNLSRGLQAVPNEPHNMVFAAGAYVQLGDRNRALSLTDQAAAHGATQQDFQAVPELDALAGARPYLVLKPENSKGQQ
jgi:serine/threonine-protein kinase